MKKLIVLCLVLVSSSSPADTLFRFKDGSANVWASYYAKGGQYCTMKSYGEYCVDRADVVTIATVPPGTPASEYSVSSLGDSELEQRRDSNSKALDSLNCLQLKTSTTQKAQEQYRTECLNNEQRYEWDEEQARTRSLQREARQQEESARNEEERTKRQKEREQKVVPSRPRSNQW